ncbi:CocE/NonD family hydrolase, partial [Steroidobacter sp.]|uniref:CocE/NonD family hydrolase n=1 Tax=Steroidobacter sp. TaxID=1978227 RepID=UPI001A3FF5F9
MKRREFILASAAIGTAPNLSSAQSAAAPSTSATPAQAQVLPAGVISAKTGVKTALVHNLLVPMRDGVLLALDLIRPDAPGQYPVVLLRTPYDKTRSRGSYLQSLAERGYIVAVQDTRGRFNSDGVFFPYRDDRADGYDTVEWLAKQPWCSGSVG